jgi:hypothetical protein
MLAMAYAIDILANYRQIANGYVKTYVKFSALVCQLPDLEMLEE